MFALPRDFFTILRSRAFRHTQYAQLYLGRAAAAPFALAHYLLVGEARGLRPCPFFDPAHRRQALEGAVIRGNLFAAFLRSDDNLATCNEFDPHWYIAHTPEAATSGLSPWRHFQKFGLANWTDPSPDISLKFVICAYEPRHQNLDRLLFELFVRRSAANPQAYPLNRAALGKNQDRFRAQIQLDIRAALPERRHDNLVFVQTAGKHPALIEADRNYDILLNYYAAPSATQNREADYTLFQKGTKVTAIDTILKQQPDILLRYKHVLFLDDDVEIDAPSINAFFATMERAGLDLAQPALTSDSISFFKELMVKAGAPDVRLFNAVEIMAPGLSSRALRQCGWAFGEGISGYGIDFLLGAEVRKIFGDKVAVINSVAARHTRPPDKESGEFYRFLAMYGIDPLVEGRDLLKVHGMANGIRAL